MGKTLNIVVVFLVVTTAAGFPPPPKEAKQLFFQKEIGIAGSLSPFREVFLWNVLFQRQRESPKSDPFSPEILHFPGIVSPEGTAQATPYLGCARRSWRESLTQRI